MEKAEGMITINIAKIESGAQFAERIGTKEKVNASQHGGADLYLQHGDTDLYFTGDLVEEPQIVAAISRIYFSVLG